MIPPKTKEDLNKIIEINFEETTTIEFKRELPPAGKNDDIAKDISAMANTEGGTIIYGIATDSNDRAESLFPFNISGASERVTQIAKNQLDEALYLDEVYTILENDENGFLVVQVPKSERAPHFYKGAAWGRTSKTNEPLNRRRIGELFAQSEGFAEEFGLTLEKPGRVYIKHEKEETIDSRGKPKKNNYLLLKNDGEKEVFNIDCEWIEFDEKQNKQPPGLINNPFPIKNMPPKYEIKIGLLMTMGTANNLTLRVHWEDNQEERHNQDYKILW